MKQYKKWIFIICICAVSVITALGHYKITQTEKTFSLIYIPKTEDGTNDFWTSLIAGTRIAAEECGVSFEVMAPDQEEDVERQNELIKQAIEKHPDALLISPSSFTESEELLEKVKENGIALTYIDSITEHSMQDLVVATDNVKAGKCLGEFATSIISGKGETAIVGHVKGVSTAMEREQGFKEGLGDHADRVVETVYCNSSFEKSYKLTQELMEKYPDLEMIAGMNEYACVGAARAVRDAGKKGKIKIVGIDISLEIVELMEQGVFQGVVIQKAFKMGYEGVRETVKLLQGKKVHANIDSGFELVTPENMYDSENEKLIFPFGN